MNTWRAIPRIKGKGVELKSPEGETVAVIYDGGIAKQIAVAMNLTTQKQRIDFLAGEAGYILKEHT